MNLKKNRFHPLTKLVVVLFSLVLTDLLGKGMGFCTHGSRSFPYLLARKSSLVYFLRLSGASSSRTSGGSFFLASFSGSTPSSVSTSEVDMLFGSTACSSSSIGSLELSASLCFFFFFFFGELTISSSSCI